jgi:hypothetical protein
VTIKSYSRENATGEAALTAKKKHNSVTRPLFSQVFGLFLAFARRVRYFIGWKMQDDGARLHPRVAVSVASTPGAADPGRIAAVATDRYRPTSTGAENNTGLVPLELRLDGADGSLKPCAGFKPPEIDCHANCAELDRLDVLGTRAFLPLAFRVRHLLAFTQFVETDALEAR